MKSKLPPAETAIEELAHLEDTSSKHQLVDCLKKGVAFHNADMNIEEREVVERHFRAGAIRVLCSTSTLAMGVNLPARNVFLETQKWHTNKRFNRPYNSPITKAEFENMGGRAGRLGFGNEFGRAILVTSSPFHKKALYDYYIKGGFEKLRPVLKDEDIDPIVSISLLQGSVQPKRPSKSFCLPHTLALLVGAEHRNDRSAKPF